jgi:mono/diheme cytochrome c family protein
MTLRRLAALAATMAIALLGALASPTPALGHGDDLPPTLAATGFFDAAGRRAFTPQYPLWSDGAAKARVIALPPGTSIDATAPDAWDFPRGTRLWKTFSHAGRAVETRFIERRADGSWRYAAYVWNADGLDATLAPARGTVLSLASAPGGRYSVPGRGDCLACHAGATVPVLGFSALQLAPELRQLADAGVVAGLPRALRERAPAIAAASATERAALGHLHGNCAHCHHSNEGRVPVRLNLMQRVADPEASAAAVLRTLVDATARYQPPGRSDARIVVPGDAAASVLALRLASRDPRVQMPPLGTEHIDSEGLALITRWIQHDLPNRKDP